MYERMLNKQIEPSEAEFMAHCGTCKELLTELDAFMVKNLMTEKLMRFPYGNDYGWSFKYFKKTKHILDLFAEKDAFTIMIRLTNDQFNRYYENYSEYTKKIIDYKYPCGAGGWIHYRVLNEENLKDIKAIILSKLNK